jgi:hypothetical protein
MTVIGEGEVKTPSGETVVKREVVAGMTGVTGDSVAEAVPLVPVVGVKVVVEMGGDTGGDMDVLVGVEDGTEVMVPVEVTVAVVEGGEEVVGNDGIPVDVDIVEMGRERDEGGETDDNDTGEDAVEAGGEDGDEGGDDVDSVDDMVEGEIEVGEVMMVLLKVKREN